MYVDFKYNILEFTYANFKQVFNFTKCFQGPSLTQHESKATTYFAAYISLGYILQLSDYKLQLIF